MLAVLFILHGASVHAQPDFAFEEVQEARGLGAYTMASGFGGGVAAADFDNDGDIDLFVPTAQGLPDQLYRNDGSGHFEEVAREFGVDGVMSRRAALWVDIDGDGRLDLAVAGDCAEGGVPCGQDASITLYRQQADGRFRDITSDSGLAELPPPGFGDQRNGIAAGDVNGDGFPDLLLGYWGGQSRLMINQGDGSFVDAGMAGGVGHIERSHWQPVFHDFNGDGAADIFMAVDFTANHLWINGPGQVFEDQAVAAGVDQAWNDMGVALGDYDNDGDFDVYVTEITERERHNMFYRNDSDREAVRFTEISITLGVADTGFGWGTTFLDADNDGWLDLAATNGWHSGVGFDDASRFFHHGGGADAVYVDVSDAVGFHDTDWGSSLIALDFDRDGDLDMVQTCNQGGPLRLLENRRRDAAAAHHYLVVRPRMDGPNSRAIGATISVTAGPLTMKRLITAGTSHLGQEPAEAFFGLGEQVLVDEVLIDWPGGGSTRLSDVPVDQDLTVRPSASAPPTPPPACGAMGGAMLVVTSILLGLFGIGRRARLDVNARADG